jgi:hypothetical protein
MNTQTREGSPGNSVADICLAIRPAWTEKVPAYRGSGIGRGRNHRFGGGARRDYEELLCCPSPGRYLRRRLLEMSQVPDHLVRRD